MATQATLPLLHRFLGIGLVILAVVFVGLRYFDIPEAFPPGQATVTLAYGMSAAGILIAAFALLVTRRRVPPRRAGQPDEQYWATPEVAAAVVPVWFTLEGAGIVAAVGYLLTAHPVTAVTAAILITVYWLYGPASFTRQA
jgi:hypothetical protein